MEHFPPLQLTLHECTDPFKLENSKQLLSRRVSQPLRLYDDVVYDMAQCAFGRVPDDPEKIFFISKNKVALVENFKYSTLLSACHEVILSHGDNIKVKNTTARISILDPCLPQVQAKDDPWSIKDLLKRPINIPSSQPYSPVGLPVKRTSCTLPLEGDKDYTSASILALLKVPLASSPSISHSDEPSTEQVCRICLEGVKSGPLLSLCLCHGSCGYLHLSCLRRWLSYRLVKTTLQGVERLNVPHYKCEVCKGAYPTGISQGGKYIDLLVDPEEGCAKLILDISTGQGRNAFVVKDRALLGSGYECPIRLPSISTRQAFIARSSEGHFKIIETGTPWVTFVEKKGWARLDCLDKMQVVLFSKDGKRCYQISQIREDIDAFPRHKLKLKNKKSKV